jgi:NADPH:quinone reductase-like Zn-dependent oxidoreductase
VERLGAFGGIDAAVDAIGGSAVEDSVAAGVAPERVASIVDHEVEAKGGKNIFVEPRAEELRALTALVEAGKLTVPVAATYSLKDAKKAWEQNQDGHTRGKIAITVA